MSDCTGRSYRYTHKRFDAQQQLICRDGGIITGTTPEAVKERLTARFGLQDWNCWTCTCDGTHQRTHTLTPQRPYRGVITVAPIKDAKK